MMLFPLKIDKIGVKYDKFNFYREVTTFQTILNHAEGRQFYCKTKEWMKILTDQDSHVVDLTRATEASKHCEISMNLPPEYLAYYSRLGIYCCPKESEVFLELLKYRSILLNRVKDIRGSTYVLEKLFKECNFYRPFDVLQCYSNEAYEALQMFDSQTTRLFLTKLKNGIQMYGKELNKDQLQEFEQRIEYIESQIEQVSEPSEVDWTKSGTKTIKKDDSNKKISEKYVTVKQVKHGEFVLEDEPRVCLLEKKGFQCDNCHAITNLLPCFDCHCVFYCSSECEIEDSIFHKYECPGLRTKVLYLIQSQVDVRNLIVTMSELKSTFLSVINDQMATDAFSLWQNLIWMHANNVSTPCYNFFYQKNDVDKVIEKDLKGICTKTIQIVVYLKQLTTFFDDFFKHVTCVNASEVEIFVSALIFRHAIIQRTKLMHFKFGVTNRQPSLVMHLNETTTEGSVEIEVAEFISKSKKFVKKFYDTCFERFPLSTSLLYQVDQGQLQRLVKKLENLYSQEENKTVFDQKFTKTFLEESTDANEYQKLLIQLVKDSSSKKQRTLKNILKRFTHAVKTSHEFYTIPKSIDNSFDQKMVCLYSNLTEIEHSCRPNTILIPRSCGRVQLYTCQTLKEGTKLTMSYGPHYLYHCRRDRKVKLEEMCVDCKCSACTENYDFYESINNEECKSCFIPIYESDGKCHGCDKKSFTNIPKHLFFRILYNYVITLPDEDIERKLHGILTTCSILDECLHNYSPLKLKQTSVLARILIMSDEPLRAFNVLEDIYALTTDVYPPMSLELCEHLLALFHMYYDMLQRCFKKMTLHEMTVDEAMQSAAQLSEKIKVIENAWGIYDTTYETYEIINFHFNKLMDMIYEAKACNDEPNTNF